jgi:hypothetical protein
MAILSIGCIQFFPTDVKEQKAVRSIAKFTEKGSGYFLVKAEKKGEGERERHCS